MIALLLHGLRLLNIIMSFLVSALWEWFSWRVRVFLRGYPFALRPQYSAFIATLHTVLILPSNNENTGFNSRPSNRQESCEAITAQC